MKELLRNINRGGGHSQLAEDKKSGSRVVYSNIIAHLLHNLEYVLKRSRNMYALTGLNIQFLALFGYVVGQVFIRLLRYYGTNSAGRIVKILCKTKVLEGTATLPRSSLIMEGVDTCHCEAVRGEKIRPIENNKQNTCGNASLIPYYSLKNLYKAEVAGAAATLPKRTYSPIHLFTHSLKKRAAFTLAEVLITLGIIGIVAAMTMPSLITNYKKQEASARLKKFNSMMGQALILSVEENGDVNEWDLSLPPKEFATKYWAPYLKALSIDENNSQAIMYFPDGTKLTIYRGRCMDCIFDVNGDKKPNVEGRDRFRFLACDKSITEWCPNKGWCTYYSGNQPHSRDKILEACKNNGAYCSALLEIDNWEFRKDYPHRL